MHNQVKLTEAIVDSSNAGIIVVDKDLHIIIWNQWIEKHTGLKSIDVYDKNITDIYPDLSSSRLIQATNGCIQNGLASTLSTRLNPHPLPLFRNVLEQKKSNYMFQQIAIKPVIFDANDRMAMIHVFDVTGSVIREQKLSEQSNIMQALMDEVSSSEARIRIILDNTLDGILTINQNGHIHEFNPAAEKIFGYHREEIIGNSINKIVPSSMVNVDEDDDDATHKVNKQLTMLLGNTQELAAVRKNGESFILELSLNKIILHDEHLFVCSMRDITERTQAEKLIRHMAQHDALTDLPNRSLFKDRLLSSMSSANRHNESVAVMFLDLDRFKTINDTLGHHAGDALLIEISKRLKLITRETDTVARLGGDEFAIIQTNIKHPDGVIALLDKIINTVSQPFKYNDNEINTSTSIGVTLYPSDIGDADQLLQNADIAMYRAKRLGRNNYQFYSIEIHEELQRIADMEKEIRLALGNNEFILHYQPQIDLTTNEVIGVEALVRWQHPEKGLIPPDQFIPIAEDSNLILPLGRLVLTQACQWAKAWQDAGNEPVRVAVNLSPVQLKDPNLVDHIVSTLTQTGLSAEYLELELTESCLMENASSAIKTLNHLHDLNIELAIDDFGTGYSSLAYLKRFPVNKIKIDRSFVNDITTDKDDAIIVQTVIGLGHSLGMKVIAEGVETQEQLEFLQMHTCNEAQGYFIGKPMPSEQLADFLKTKFQPSPAIHSIRRICNV